MFYEKFFYVIIRTAVKFSVLTDASVNKSKHYLGIFQYHGDNDELRFLFPLEDAYSTPDKIYALGLECCIPLATPLTYQLSAQEIKSLLGVNNVWSDAGDVDVEYRADTKLYIDKRLAEVTR